MEQILASHSQIEGAQELPFIERFTREYRNSRYPAALGQLASEDFHRLGERYMNETRAYLRGKSLFIDKMPDNFPHIGLIHLMLPKARIIDVRREPMACCVSNLKQPFACGQELNRGELTRWRHFEPWLGPLKDALAC